jgi:hypothetical protein
MDKKNKLFFIVFFLVLFGSIGATYYRTMIKRDYMISAQIDCDPYVEKCFIWECDPISTVEGEACTGEAENDIWYYQIVERKAYNVPLCNPDDENCEALICSEGEKDCGTTFCNEENKIEQGVECNDPVQYAIDNPEEEEAAECEEGDEECLAAEEEASECEEGDEECLAAEQDGEEETATEEGSVEEDETETKVKSEVPVVNSIFPVDKK